MLRELKNIFSDPAALLIMLLLPLAYPLLYSFIYTNEVVRDMPICVVDLSDTQESRKFTRQLDATQDVAVTYRVNDFEEAKRLMREQKVHGILYFPSDFAEKLQKMEQSPIEIYTDMGFLLYYKAFYLATYTVMLAQKHPLMLNEPEPIKVHEYPMFNPYGGYGNFLLPAVLVLILQQTLILGMATQVGTQRQRGYDFTIKQRLRQGLGYYFIYFLMAGYVLLVVPRLFQFTQMISVGNFLLLLFPMILSMVTFGILVSQFFKHRETPLMYIAPTSIILIFLTGISWPETSMPQFWQSFAWILPSTPAVRAFVKMNSMGADISMVSTYIWALLAQSVVYILLYLAIKLYYEPKHLKPVPTTE
ncbi:MAG: ABC transporter permease [Bacteroidales bacterium]|nr:ABC transporter permease [Bacteroidales bacterium]